MVWQRQRTKPNRTDRSTGESMDLVWFGEVVASHAGGDL